MPFITKYASMLEHSSSSESLSSKSREPHAETQVFTNGHRREQSTFSVSSEELAEDEGNMSDASTSSSLLDRARPRKSRQVLLPLIPDKSNLRSSRILENLTIQLHDLQKSAQYDLDMKLNGDMGTLEDPHESYLSSEEEGSENTEDVDEYDASYVSLDSESLTQSSASASRTSSVRSSLESARQISFVFVGKPTVIDIPLRSTPSTPEQKPNLPPRTTSRQTPRTLQSTSQLLSRRDLDLSTLNHLSQALELNYTTRSSKHEGYPAAEASEIQVNSPIAASAAPITTTTKLRNRETTLDAAAPTELSRKWKSGLERTRMMVARKRPSMPMLSAAFQTLRETAERERGGLEIERVESIREEAYNVPATVVVNNDDEASNERVGGETEGGSSTRSLRRLSLNLSTHRGIMGERNSFEIALSPRREHFEDEERESDCLGLGLGLDLGDGLLDDGVIRDADTRSVHLVRYEDVTRDVESVQHHRRGLSSSVSAADVNERSVSSRNRSVGSGSSSGGSGTRKLAFNKLKGLGRRIAA